MIGFGKRVLAGNEMAAMRQFLAAVLEQQVFTMVRACDGVQALCELQRRHVDMVVTDYHMPRLNGLDLLRQSQMVWPEVPVIFFSDLERDTGGLTQARGAIAWIRQLSDPGILLSMLALAVEQGVDWKPRRATEWVGV